jgi:hypothetical protein
VDDVTATASTAVRRSRTVIAKLDALRGIYQRRPCVIVTCGPSLGRIDHERLRGAVHGVPVIAIKQAIDVVGDQADMVCFNSYNVRRLHVSSPATIRVFAPEPSGTVPQHNRYDLALPMAAHDGMLRSALAATRDFKRFELDHTPVRPWGPGIMHELALYLAVHSGVSKIFTVGWDIATGSDVNVHYDDRPNDAVFFSEGRSRVRLSATRRWMPRWARCAARTARSWAAHHRGEPYNRVGMQPGEGPLVAGSVPATRAWLASRGIDLHIVSDQDAPGTPTVPVGCLFNQLETVSRATSRSRA